MISEELIQLSVPAGAAMESQSGLQNLNPKIFGRLARGDAGGTAAIVMHPTSNFMGHYLVEPLARRGVTCFALNSRYVGNDIMLSMERVLLDLGAGVRFLREQGYRRVLLIGNSGGAALAAYYQAEAEKLTARVGPDGRATGLSADALPPADGVVLSAAHAGRARLMVEWLDPSVIDETDPFATDPAFDLYAPGRNMPFSGEFVERFRAAQRERRDRIDGWVQARLRQIEADPALPDDQAFLVYRTHSDPRFLDLTIDANDRPVGSIWGDPRAVNYGANAMGRLCTLRSWLSQWSAFSRADGPANLARTSVPVLLFVHTADGSTFPSTAKLWRDAAAGRLTEVSLKQANHYLSGQPHLVESAADTITQWTGSERG